MRIICSGLTAIACLIGGNCAAETQTLTLMRGIDAPHYDAQRTGYTPAADVVNMIQDTLVALDWDGRTPIPNLAKSWQISPDGKTYTFKLRDDVTFCSGKKFTADDVVYTFKRLQDPQTRAPQAWRAGKIKELRAPDPYTVEYELEEPDSGLLLQLTVFTNVIINQESVERLGKDYGVNGVDGTGPWCFVSWQPRNEVVLRRHDAYRWGPAMYENRGPVHFDRLVIKNVPEEFEPGCGNDGGHVRLYQPVSDGLHSPGKGDTDASGAGSAAQLPTAFLRFQDDARDGVRPAGEAGDEHRDQPRRAG